jgi:hypothetical protein
MILQLIRQYATFRLSGGLTSTAIKIPKAMSFAEFVADIEK